MILKDHFNVGILLCEDITLDEFIRVIQDKYDFNRSELIDITLNTRFENRPKLVRGKNILFTDGGYINNKNVTLLFDDIFYFACGNKDIVNINEENIHVLFDIRVYDYEEMYGFNYKKKILFDRLKKPTKESNNILLYATKNCRALNADYLKMLSNNMPCDNILCLVNEIPPEKYSNITFSVLPYNNLMDNFDTYIYTPVDRKFDCSPRLIAECAYFDKRVVYDIDYWEEDLGLSWRKFDIEWNWDSLVLKEDDEIINYLKRYI